MNMEQTIQLTKKQVGTYILFMKSILHNIVELFSNYIKYVLSTYIVITS